MHSPLVHDIAIVLIAAGAAGWLCKCLGMSAIVGYLLAGIIIGPNTPVQLIDNEKSIEGLAEVGLVFVMFAIGMHLGLRKMMDMGFRTIFATMLGAVFMLLVTLLFGQILGWNYQQCLFLAAMLMVSSSAVIAKIMQELHLTHDRTAQTVLGMTISEDIVAVIMLTVLGTVSKVAGKTGVEQSPMLDEKVTEDFISGVGQVGSIFTNISSFVVLVLAACLLFVPKLVRRLEISGDPDLRNVGVAGLLLILAFCAQQAGFSLALGAFLFGAIIAELPQKNALEKSFESVRSIFSSLFFFSIGMMANPRAMFDWKVLGLTIALVLFALIGRPIACGFAMLLTGSSPEEARRGGLLLTPLGEFTFLIAQSAVTASVFPEYLYPVSISLAIFTVFATPFMNRHADVILRVATKLEPAFITRLMELYHVWLEKLSHRSPKDRVWKTIFPKLIQSLLEVLLATGVVVFVPPLWDTLKGKLPEMLNDFGYVMNETGESALRIAFWSLVGVFVFALWLSIWRNIRDVIPVVARGFSGAYMPRQVLASAFWVLFGMLFVAWLTILFPTWTSRLSLSVRVLPFLLFLAAIIAAGLYLSRLLHTWRKTVETTLAEKKSHDDADGEHGEKRAGVWNQFAGELGDWDVRLQDCVLPENAACAGESLRTLAIPSQFGVSIVSIDRNGHCISRPGADSHLYPGDRLSLLGQKEALAKAQQFLATTKRSAASELGLAGAQLILETCKVLESPRTGHSLAELRITETTGIHIAAIQRNGKRIVNPAGNEQLLPGDDLLVMGASAQVKKFEKWLVAPFPQENATPA